MTRSNVARAYSILGAIVAILLLLQPLFGLLDLPSPIDVAGGVQAQGDATACSAVGSNWTSCGDAFASDDVSAYANNTPVGGGALNIALVVDNPLALDPNRDVPARDHMVNVLGHTVTYQDDDDQTWNPATFDAVVISESVLSFKTAWLKNEAVGLLTLEGANWDELELGSAGSSAGGGDTDIDITDNTHYITAVFPTGVRTVTTATTNLGEMRGWANGVNKLGHYAASPTMAKLLEVEKGGILQGGVNTAAERRVFLGAQFFGNLNADGKTLFNRSLDWVAYNIPGLSPGKNDTAWRNFGFVLNDSDLINSVEIGVEWFRNNTAPILNVTLSWDGGLTWATNQTATNRSADDDLVEFLDFTSATAWNASKLRDARLRVRVGTNASGTRLDYVTVRVNLNTAPVISNLRLEDGGGASQAGESLDVDVDYFFLFNVTDDDGWADIGGDGNVSLRFWYDGNTTPEQTFGDQSTGANYRIVLTYQDTSDPGNASLGEWTVTEGWATYNASASGLTPIMSGSVLIGYEFRLGIRLGFQVKQARDPTNATTGVYNDPDSWNVEAVAHDGIHVVTLQAASTGEHMEFGVTTYTFVTLSANWTVTAGPGQAANTNTVTVLRRSNDDFTLRVWFVTDLTKGLDTIAATNVQALAAADPNDSITVDTAFAGVGKPNAIFVLGSVTWSFNHSANTTEDTTAIQFGVVVPVGAGAGSYTAPVQVEIEDIDGMLLSSDEREARVQVSNTVPVLSNFRLQDSGGASKEGGSLDVGVAYYFLFNITDGAGWADIADDGSVSLRLWYDGNVTPELAFEQQTSGADYRIEVRYQDASDPSTASLSEWSVVEGQATYAATTSGLTAIVSGGTVIGYEFRLAVTLSFQVRRADDPVNGSVGTYNDRNSWNAEVTGSDGVGLAVLQTASTGAQMEFGVVVDPDLSFLVAAPGPVVQPGQSIVFRVNFTNAGPGESALLWVNITLPAELTYVGDDAASIGGVRSGAFSFQFTSVAPGEYVFNVTASVNGAVADGTVAVTNFTFEVTDPYGQPWSQAAQDVAVAIANAGLGVSVTSNNPLVDPGDTLIFTVTVTNLGSGIAANVAVEVLVDPNATYLASSPPGTYDAIACLVRWSAASLDPGAQLSFQWTAEVIASTPDRATVTSPVRVEYQDVTGAALPPVTASAQSIVQAPVFSPTLYLDRSAAERGDEVGATLYYNNTGSGTALLAWMNWSLGGHYELVALLPDTPYATTAEGFALVLTRTGPGPHSLEVRLRVLRGMVDNLAMEFEVAWAATDGNGNLLQRSVLPRVASLLAPSVAVTLESGPASVSAGSPFSLNLTLRNLGQAAATAWLNLTLPAGVVYAGDDGMFPLSQTADRVTWRISSLPAGSSVVLRVSLRPTGESAFGSFRFALDFTDGKGSPPELALSNTISVQFLPVGSPLELPWWLFVIVVAAAAAAALLLVMRRRSPGLEVEEAFIVHRGGMLLAHLSVGIPNRERDQDLLMSIFTTMKDIVPEAIVKSKPVPIRLQHGDLNVLLERGEHHYAVVVFRGEDDGSLAELLAKLSRHIEREFGEVLESWEGDPQRVLGIRKLIPILWGERPGRGPKVEGQDPERDRTREEARETSAPDTDPVEDVPSPAEDPLEAGR